MDIEWSCDFGRLVKLDGRSMDPNKCGVYRQLLSGGAASGVDGSFGVWGQRLTSGVLYYLAKDNYNGLGLLVLGLDSG